MPLDESLSWGGILPTLLQVAQVYSPAEKADIFAGAAPEGTAPALLKIEKKLLRRFASLATGFSVARLQPVLTAPP
jgi:hypothetical protein